MTIPGFDPKNFNDAGYHFFNGAFRAVPSADKMGAGAGKAFESILKNMGTGGGKGLADAINEFFKNANFGGAGAQAGQGFNDFFKNLKFAQAGADFGKEWSSMFGNATTPMAEAVGKAFGQLGSNLSWSFLTSWAPTILGFSAAVVAVPLAIRYVYHKMIYDMSKPKLAIKQRFASMFSPITGLFGGSKSKEVAPSFNDEISRQIKDITTAIPNIQKNKGYFQNVILYGPGGTGKTMVSEMMAKDANVNYVMMSGGDLPQYIKRGEHVTELNRLFDKIEKSSTPTVLFIDEAESFAKDRGDIEKPELLELQNAFLNRTGTPSKKLMIVMATNRIEDIDPAILSRMDYKIHIGVPALRERVSILKTYIPQFFNEKERQALFSDTQVQAIANKIDGLTGRAIFKMLNTMSCKKAATSNGQLTQSIIDQTVDDLVKQEKAADKMVQAGKSVRMSKGATPVARSAAAPAA